MRALARVTLFHWFELLNGARRFVVLNFIIFNVSNPSFSAAAAMRSSSTCHAARRPWRRRLPTPMQFGQASIKWDRGSVFNII